MKRIVTALAAAAALAIGCTEHLLHELRRALWLLASLALLPGPGGAQDYAKKGFKLAAPTSRETTSENLAAGACVCQRWTSRMPRDTSCFEMTSICVSP